MCVGVCLIARKRVGERWRGISSLTAAAQAVDRQTINYVQPVTRDLSCTGCLSSCLTPSTFTQNNNDLTSGCSTQNAVDNYRLEKENGFARKKMAFVCKGDKEGAKDKTVPHCRTLNLDEIW